jgi:hypothetical protein
MVLEPLWNKELRISIMSSRNQFSTESETTGSASAPSSRRSSGRGSDSAELRSLAALVRSGLYDYTSPDGKKPGGPGVRAAKAAMDALKETMLSFTGTIPLASVSRRSFTRPLPADQHQVWIAPTKAAA